MKNKLITMIAAITMLFACNAEYTPEQIVKLYGWKLNSALDENAITEGNVDAVRLLAQSNRNYGVLIECAAIKGETKDLIDTVTFMYNTTTNWSANSIAFMRYVHNYDIKEVTSVLFGNSPNKYICTQLYNTTTVRKYPILRTLRDEYAKVPVLLQKKILNECLLFFAYLDDQTDTRSFNAALSQELKTGYVWVWLLTTRYGRYGKVYDLDQTVENYFNSRSSLEPEAILHNEEILRKYYALNGDAAFFKKNIGAIPADAQIKVILEFNDTDMLIAALKTVPENLEPESIKQIVLLFNALDADDARCNAVVAILKNINKKYTLKMYDDQKTWEPIISRVRALIEVMAK